MDVRGYGIGVANANGDDDGMMILMTMKYYEGGNVVWYWEGIG